MSKGGQFYGAQYAPGYHGNWTGIDRGGKPLGLAVPGLALVKEVLKAADRAPNYDTGQISKSLAAEIANMRRQGVDYRNQTKPEITIHTPAGSDVNASFHQLPTAGGGFSGPLP